MISKTYRLLHRRALVLLLLQPKPLLRRRELRMPALPMPALLMPALLMTGERLGRLEATIGGRALTGVAGARKIGSRRSLRTRVGAGLRMVGLAMIRVHRADLARMRSGDSMLTFNALPLTRDRILGCRRMARELRTPDH